MSREISSIIFTNDADEEITLVCRYEVCQRCAGTGYHVNPSIDGDGITASEMQELGDEFENDYFDGIYDVQCEECKGNRVVNTPDENLNRTVDLIAYREYIEEKERFQAEIDAERRAGC